MRNQMINSRQMRNTHRGRQGIEDRDQTLASHHHFSVEIAEERHARAGGGRRHPHTEPPTPPIVEPPPIPHRAEHLIEEPARPRPTTPTSAMPTDVRETLRPPEQKPLGGLRFVAMHPIDVLGGAAKLFFLPTAWIARRVWRGVWQTALWPVRATSDMMRRMWHFVRPSDDTEAAQHA